VREKMWNDCPSCGTVGSMKKKVNLKDNLIVKDYGKISLDHLEGYECSKCHDAIFSKRSQSMINAKIAELKAKVDSNKIVASQLASVDEMAKKYKITRQAIHKMMNNGKIRYVFVGDIRLPLKDQNLQFK
jgi:Ser-tRNA(Ala) deacylase AlaX